MFDEASTYIARRNVNRKQVEIIQFVENCMNLFKIGTVRLKKRRYRNRRFGVMVIRAQQGTREAKRQGLR